MKQYVVTITREFGSMGREIARELSQMLGIMFYDRDIVEEVSKQMNLPVSTISNVEEKSRSHFFYMKFPLGTDSSYMQDTVFEAQRSIITDLAKQNSCIIVGRCADYILADNKNALHFYIYAPYEARYNNCIKELGMKEEEAARLINSVDKARISYHKRYAGYEPGDYNHKNFCIDSSVLGISGTAELMAEIIRHKFKITGENN